MTDQFVYQNANQDLVNQTQPYGCFDYNNQAYMNFQNPNPSNFTPNNNSNWNQNQSTNFNQNADCYQNFNTSQFNSQQTLPNVSQFNSYPPVQNNFSLNNLGFNNMQSTNLPLDNFSNQNIFQDNSRSGSSNYKGAPGNNRNSGQNFNKVTKRGGFSNNGMEEQHDTIFVSGLPESTTEMQLQEYFGSIGLIKMDKKTGKPKIWIYRDKESQKPKGEVTITYDDPPTAKSAINWFDGKDFYGSIIKVELAQRKNNYLNFGKSFGNTRDNNNRNSGRDYDKNSNNDRNSGSGGREGDWLCPNPSCKNNNFAWRTMCNRCKTDKPNGGSGGGNGSSNFSSGRNDDRRSGSMPSFERRNNIGGPPSGRRDGLRGNGNSFSRGGRNGGQQGSDRSFNKYGGNRDQRGGGRNGGLNSGGRSGGSMRGSDNKRLVPY